MSKLNNLTDFLTSLANSFRNILGTQEAINPQDFDDLVGQVYDEGKDEFWNAYQPSEEIANAHFMFAGEVWNDSNFNPKRTLKPKDAKMMFDESGIVDLAGVLERNNVELDLSSAKNVSYLFYYAQTEHLPVVNMQYATLGRLSVFEGSKAKIIDGLILPSAYDYRNGYDSELKYPFKKCSDLTSIKDIQGFFFHNISFEWSPLLDKGTIERVIGALSESAQEINKTVTFKKQAVDNAFETSEGSADGSSSAEWASLISTKQNWTISLV